jgi:uncharacterized repeat protein (TIGR03803 family)
MVIQGKSLDTTSEIECSALCARCWIKAVAIVLLAVTFISQPARGQTYTVLYNFTGGTDGGNPHAGLVADSAGNLYGTATGGGASTNCQGFGCGVVYKLNASAKETVLHSFSGGVDGAYPYSTLVRDADGNLYGTTAYGGNATGSCSQNHLPGCGVIFRVDPAGLHFVVLHRFSMTDGNNPSGVIRDASGNLYGTTFSGGGLDQGVVFKLSPTGKYTVLYSFTGGSDGASPLASVTEDAAGNLYGTTSAGGNQGCGVQSSCGVAFKLDPAGNETVLHSFGGSAEQGDGASPAAPLIQDPWGNLYGTTDLGGAYNGPGTVFKLDSSGDETVLLSFSGGATGAYPQAGLLRDTAGNLYGTTEYGGSHQSGTIFKLGPTGVESVLHAFAGTDGANPTAPLNFDQAVLYGTALTGGAYGAGVVFKLTLH